MSDATTAPAPTAPGPLQLAAMDMLRSVLMGVGTPFLAKGYFTGDQESWIIGGLCAGASALWSYAAKHPGKLNPLQLVRSLVARGGQQKAWNSDLEAAGTALTPVIERIADAEIRAHAGAFAGPADDIANAVIRDGVGKAEAAASIPQSQPETQS